MIEEILERISTPGNPRFTKDQQLFMINNTKFLSDDSSIRERLYYISNDYKEIQYCKCCNKNATYWNLKVKKMHQFCKVCIDNPERILASSNITETYSNELIELVDIQHDKNTTSNWGKPTSYPGQLLRYETNFLDISKGLQERIWYVSRLKYTSELCCVCNNRTPSWCNNSYNEVCPNCVKSYHKTKEKAKKTWLKKYGVEHPFNRPDVIEKRKQLLIENKEQIVKKRQETCLRRYGVRNVWHTPIAIHSANIKKNNSESKEKAKKTWLKKYGVEHPFNRPDVIEKRKQLLIENKEQIVKKRQETIKKYNEFRLSTLTFDSWAKKVTNLKNYSNIQLRLLFDNCINNKDWLISQTDKKRTILHLSDSLGLNYRLLCRSYEYYNIDSYRSPNSYPEFQITKYISDLGFQVDNNTRSVIGPLELDIYLLDEKLAIEYNGLYWHRDLGNNKDYHLNKTNLCQEQGIQLFHIFENEWIDPTKQTIWKSIIKNRLGKSSRIYARKTKVAQITSKDKKQFLIDNHLQGNCASSVNLGLYLDDELVSVMTFGKSRYDKKIDWELLRFCNKRDYSVVGGASKLLAAFRRENNGSIISYADKRRSTGGLYKSLGFDYSHDSKPNYWYFKISNIINIYHRSIFMKHKLKDKLDKFDPNMTELDNMVINGWNRIFDCGNQVWIKI